MTISHTEPVTVAAEQGIVGLAAYVGLLVAALWAMGAGLFDRTTPRAGGPAARSLFIARVAVLATFVALVVHTMAYAGFYEDPITWVLLALAAALAADPVRQAT